MAVFRVEKNKAIITCEIGNYKNISVKEKEVELKNDYDGESMVLKDVNGLKWV